MKYNYDRWNALPTELQDYSYYLGAVFGGYGAESNVASTEAPDATTVVITLKKPSSNFLLSQTLPPFAISSPTALKAGGADNTVTDVTQIPYAQGGPPAMVGTGPFMFKSWTLGDNVTHRQEPRLLESRRDGGTSTRSCSSRSPTRPQRLNGLAAGEIDLVQTVAPVDITTIQDNAKLQVIDRGESCNLAHLAMNQKFQPFDNPKIREAIAYAIDKEALIEAFYAGQAERGRQLDAARHAVLRRPRTCRPTTSRRPRPSSPNPA